VRRHCRRMDSFPGGTVSCLLALCLDRGGPCIARACRIPDALIIIVLLIRIDITSPFTLGG
jgi:hypothetical protein